MDPRAPHPRRRVPSVEAVLFAVTTGAVAAGFLASPLWVAGAAVGLVAATVWVAGSLRRREPGVDVIAVLALVGSLAVDEPLAGAVIAWMLASGRLLEQRAQARARRELSLLVARAPRTARRRTGGDPDGSDPDEGVTFVEIGVGEVVRGDVLLVGPGEVVPVDGHTVSVATLDESALTGESLQVDHVAGDEVRSGAVNAASPFELVASTAAADSTYARIVRLVEQAQASSAPFVRAADRVAVAFVPLTLALAGAAWALSGDPVRAVAVLVVATPCPLLLAAPIAVISGLSQAARRGVVVKGGGALERLAAGRVLLLDKTGTLTRGRPTVRDVVLADPPAPDAPDAATLLRLAASLDQVSPHVLANAVVSAGRGRGLALALPSDVEERHGSGIEGDVDGLRVRVGKAAWVVGAPGSPDEPAWARRVRRRSALDGTTAVLVGVTGVPAGALLLEDPMRPDAPRTIRALRRAGFERVVLVTGDREDVAQSVGRVVGVDAVHAETDPQGKLDVVREESRHGLTVMVGDGVNDAPALAAAGVGVALAARGATASSETADVVLTVDRVDRLAEAVGIARRSRRIAFQAVGVGMGLSLVAMGFAAAGLLAPTAGALLQEVVDVLAIGVALRAVLPARRRGAARLTPADVELMTGFHAEHDAVRGIVEEVRVVADRVAPGSAADRLDEVQTLLRRLETELLPHELGEEERLYPVVARVLGGDDPIGAMSRTHAEISHQVWRLRRMLEPGEAPDPVEVQRLLYGLYAVLRLHDVQEEEGMFSLIPSQ
ncbi:heavy metal translocating P-type ATPase [Kineosporia sp. A_224]|uniref:heavy metal translocating P-type ATPase n=1 Tax=Kineosporia sp. A_224 TaxID=1962180 RepID=UPI000B4AE8C9|nr:heavy metal translocating P-type ATPase [Kineosporia sp. A_224]